jgi:hypothetical protein
MGSNGLDGRDSLCAASMDGVMFRGEGLGNAVGIGALLQLVSGVNNTKKYSSRLILIIISLLLKTFM